MSTAMVSIEGVLASPAQTFLHSQVNPEGLRVYSAIAAYYRVVLVTDESMEHAGHWLRTNGVTGYADVLPGPPTAWKDTHEARAIQLRTLRASRTPVGLVLDVDPATVALAMAQGVTGLLYALPRPAARRVDMQRQPIRAWDLIVAEQDANRQPVEFAQTAETGTSS